MARSFSNAKSVFVFITNETSALMTRRGFAAIASQSGVSSSGRTGAAIPNVMLKKGSEDTAKTAWAPDPVTGYYRPENVNKEVDAAELRAVLLKNKTGGQ